MSDPYRDSIENRVNRLEERVEETNQANINNFNRLEKRINDAKLVPSIWGTIRSTFYNITHWVGWGDGGGLLGLGIVGITLVFIFDVPSYVRSCNQESLEAQRTTLQQRTQACEALGLRYMEYHDDSARYTDHGRNYIICAGEDRVVYINPAFPDRSYSRRLEQLEQVTLPTETE